MLKAVLTDIDGTITDSSRRINTGAINTIRSLVDDGIEVVLASGNTSCFMDALCKMIGTHGTLIAENGGVFRVGFTGTPRIRGDQEVCRYCTGITPDELPHEGNRTGALQPHLSLFRSGIWPHSTGR
ncbi:MAG: HAD hydrolase family protein [Methanoregula sp.]